MAHGVIFQGKEHRLSKIHTRLMACLIEANGDFCTRDALCQAGWPNEAAWVTEKNFYETMRQLTEKIGSFAPGWLKSENRQGYRLRDPQVDISIQREAKNGER